MTHGRVTRDVITLVILDIYGLDTRYGAYRKFSREKLTRTSSRSAGGITEIHYAAANEQVICMETQSNVIRMSKEDIPLISKPRNYGSWSR